MSGSILLKTKNLLDESFTKIETQISCEIYFVFQLHFESRAAYEIMWENMADPKRPQMTIQYGARALHAGYKKLQIHAQICNAYRSPRAQMLLL